MTDLPEAASGHQRDDDAEAGRGAESDDEPEAGRADPAPGGQLSEEERRRYEALKAEIFGPRCGSDGCC